MRQEGSRRTDIFADAGEEREERIKKFEISNTARLTVSEWRTLLAFAYEGPNSMYYITKKCRLRYASVLRATRKLEKMGWIKLLKEGKSQKNVTIKIYGLTLEGLLWLFSRIPKTVYPGLIVTSDSDVVGRKLRERLEHEDLQLISKLKNNDDVYLHLLFYFDIDRIAEKNGQLCPQVLGNWAKFKDIEIAEDLRWLLPETAFSTLVDYYYRYDLYHKYGSLDEMLTHKLVEALLNMFIRAYPHVSGANTLENRIVNKMLKMVEKVPDIKSFVAEILEKMEKGHSHELKLIRKLRSYIATGLAGK